MPPDQFIPPARLRRIDTEKADQTIRVPADVRRNFVVRHPDSGELRFTAEYNRPLAIFGGCFVFFPADRKVHFYAIARSRRLSDEVGREVSRIGKEMAMNVNNHVNNRVRIKVASITLTRVSPARTGLEARPCFGLD